MECYNIKWIFYTEKNTLFNLKFRDFFYYNSLHDFNWFLRNDTLRNKYFIQKNISCFTLNSATSFITIPCNNFDWITRNGTILNEYFIQKIKIYCVLWHNLRLVLIDGYGMLSYVVCDFFLDFHVHFKIHILYVCLKAICSCNRS